MRQGASRDEVLEALGMAIYMGAGPAAMYAAQAVEAFDQFRTKACLLITSLDVSYAVCRSRWSPYH